MASMETIYSFKVLLEKIGSKNYDFREKKFYINPQDKVNYLFNSSINGIEESDLIILIGCNPRHEGTILNARIRKSFVKNKTKIYSIGNPGDLTYDYTLLGDDLSEIKNILKIKVRLHKKLKIQKTNFL
jgi:NADH-quinone oxidoreductase subunit G